MIVIHLPFPTPSQNERDRMHVRAREKFKEQCCAAIMVSLSRQQRYGLEWPDERVAIKVIRYSAGILDKGNLIGGCKDLLDALVAMRVIRDDSPKWLDDQYEQVNAKRGAGMTTVEVNR